MTHAEHPDSGLSQEGKILWLLQSAWPGWVPAPELAKISLQYSARIFSLRRRRGWLIENRVRTVDGKKHGEFRLGSKPVASSAELRRDAEPSPAPADSRALQEKQSRSPSPESGRRDQAREWIASARAPVRSTEPAATLFDLSPETRYPD